MKVHNLDVSMGELNFDDKIKGQRVAVSYTHHQPPENGVIGEPLFLAYDKNGKALFFYLIGLAAAKAWIREADGKVLKAEAS